MELVGKARRVRIYLKESDVIGRRPAAAALLDWLRSERAAGATVLRCSAGVGSSGRLRADLSPDAGPQLPVIIEWIDAPDRVARLLPRLLELVGRGLVP